MVDLTDICGDSPLRISLCKKLAKVNDKLIAIESAYQARRAPLNAEMDMYNDMIAAIDRRAMASIPITRPVEEDNSQIDIENAIAGTKQPE